MIILTGILSFHNLSPTSHNGKWKIQITWRREFRPKDISPKKSFLFICKSLQPINIKQDYNRIEERVLYTNARKQQISKLRLKTD